MRITNKVIQNNSIYNINSNKVLQDKLNTQMATTKKITRPSDDPVIAIRALRLRSNVAQVTQFHEKNAEDADSWLTITADSLKTVSDVLTDLVYNANQASNKNKTTQDLQIFMQQMESLADEFYSTGNVDFAGRYVFTGYRTNTAMTFSAEDVKKDNNYTITEQLTVSAIDSVNYTNMAGLENLTKENMSDYASVTEQAVTNTDIIRIRLSYDNIDTNSNVTITDSKGEPLKKADNTELSAITNVKLADDPYKKIAQANKNKTEAVIFVPETGELLMSQASYDSYFKDLDAKEELRVTYDKSSWETGDLRPEHYFACWTDKADSNKAVAYNKSYLTDSPELQHIEYDVGYNQTIRVNTTASEVFSPDVRRIMDDLKNAMESLTSIDGVVTTLKAALSEAVTDADKTRIQNQLDAANKAYEHVRENVHSLFESTMTGMQNILNDTSVAITDNGTRGQRLDLISSRLLAQKTTYKDLQSSNEDADIAEVAIQLTSMELAYQSALMATGKILQNSLMNFIS